MNKTQEEKAREEFTGLKESLETTLLTYATRNGTRHTASTRELLEDEATITTVMSAILVEHLLKMTALFGGDPESAEQVIETIERTFGVGMDQIQNLVEKIEQARV
jgi:hypothetical protein